MKWSLKSVSRTSKSLLRLANPAPSTCSLSSSSALPETSSETWSRCTGSAGPGNYANGDRITKDYVTKLVGRSIPADWSRPRAPVFAHCVEFIDVELCNSVIRHYADQKRHWHSLFVFTQMHMVGIRPNSSTFPAVLKSISRVCLREICNSIHAFVTKMGFERDVYVSSSLLNAYSVCSSAKDARKVFDAMPERNSVSWNALITSCTHNRKFIEAIDVFREMQACGVPPTAVTMVGILSACAHLGALRQGRWIHEYINCSSLNLNVFLGTALIDMYAKCGVVKEMEEVFDAMKVRNVYTWNVLISGFGMNGCGNAALNAFDRMVKEKFRPDGLTFLGVLCACCHEGLVDSGRRYFSSMTEKFRIHPWIEHYGCMVDLLSRAGLLVEALDLIENMKLRPDPIIWRALLGGCRIHGNTEMGEYAIRKLLAIEPGNAENYVLLSKLFAQDRRWADMEDLRSMMNRKAIRKVPGCSLIEVKGKVHEFMAADSVIANCHELYSFLADINEELKRAGYVAKIELVSYDLEEEEKEHALTFHSEKLALAFGLLKSPLGSTIRIVKNLRVCQDCHGFFKLVSLVYKREISLRDRNRFHHFVEGACSCKDYW
ncbi:pentatricopeptide repeat-containing protein At4g21065-like [Punica granatum]|uniref:Pentatricopeptide repeat-containing protein At4g21065-like n=2 Tax=Punica granatum TaxID=22663 RepID=A0A218VZD1_PUNGR|nr:pentatricopeptide repeat-containing protein At4g21065-like [Punica granatum]OWM65252.1 hypothetical protein CDL15_Pgr008842 [Punica granatum]